MLIFIQLTSGLSSSGIDLGSGYVMPVNKPSAMMLIGTGNTVEHIINW